MSWVKLPMHSIDFGSLKSILKSLKITLISMKSNGNFCEYQTPWSRVATPFSPRGLSSGRKGPGHARLDKTESRGRSRILKCGGHNYVTVSMAIVCKVHNLASLTAQTAFFLLTLGRIWHAKLAKS